MSKSIFKCQMLILAFGIKIHIKCQSKIFYRSSLTYSKHNVKAEVTEYRIDDVIKIYF